VTKITFTFPQGTSESLIAQKVDQLHPLLKPLIIFCNIETGVAAVSSFGEKEETALKEKINNCLIEEFNKEGITIEISTF
jgi:hypothetical protein